ncbi:MAG: 50S ribosomal protein L10 [Caldilineae bacterium]|nr:MAG: 50S ribosomal protein L10 [Caldilineae bacterium]
MTRERKVELIDSYKEKIESSAAVVMARYSGLTVGQMQKLRNSLREGGASFVIAKKTLMSRALAECERPVPEEALDGPVGFAFLGEDLAAGAKALKDFAKEVGEAFVIQGGILGDSVLDAKGALALADLPSREVQLAMLVGAIAGPLTSLAGLISAPHRDLVGILQARIDKEGGSEAAAEAA